MRRPGVRIPLPPDYALLASAHQKSYSILVTDVWIDEVTARRALAALRCLAAKLKYRHDRAGGIGPRATAIAIGRSHFSRNRSTTRNLAIARAASDLYKSTDKKRSGKRNPGTKEMTDSSCHPKIT